MGDGQVEDQAPAARCVVQVISDLHVASPFACAGRYLVLRADDMPSGAEDYKAFPSNRYATAMREAWFLWPVLVGIAAALVALALRRVRQRTIVARERARRRALALEEQRDELHKRAAKSSKEQLQATEPAPHRPKIRPAGLSSGLGAGRSVAEVGSDAAADLQGQQRQKESVGAASEERKIELARRTGLLNFLPSVRPSEQIASFAPSLRVLALADANSEKCSLQWLCLRNVLVH